MQKFILVEVTITEDIDSLKNDDKILAIGSSKTISYQYQTSSELMANYFKIIDESNSQILTLIDKFKLQKTQYFPIFGFSKINTELKSIEKLKAQQIDKLPQINGKIPCAYSNFTAIEEILQSEEISTSYITSAIVWGIISGNISLDEVEIYLRNYEDKETTDYRKLLCAYDYKKYS